MYENVQPLMTGSLQIRYGLFPKAWKLLAAYSLSFTECNPVICKM